MANNSSTGQNDSKRLKNESATGGSGSRGHGSNYNTIRTEQRIDWAIRPKSDVFTTFNFCLPVLRVAFLLHHRLQSLLRSIASNPLFSYFFHLTPSPSASSSSFSSSPSPSSSSLLLLLQLLPSSFLATILYPNWLWARFGRSTIFNIKILIYLSGLITIDIDRPISMTFLSWILRRQSRLSWHRNASKRN